MAYIKRTCKNKTCSRVFSTQDERKVYCTRQCGSNWRGRAHHQRNMKIIRAHKRAEREKGQVTV
jgi:hypothetical protein